MGHLSGLDGCLAGRCSPPMVAHATRVMFQVNFQPKTPRRERQHTRHPQGVQPTAQTPSCVRLPTAVCRRIDLRGGSVDVPNAQSLFYCPRVWLLPKTSVSRSKMYMDAAKHPAHCKRYVHARRPWHGRSFVKSGFARSTRFMSKLLGGLFRVINFIFTRGKGPKRPLAKTR